MKVSIVLVLATAVLASALPKPVKQVEGFGLAGLHHGRIVGGVEARRHEFPWLVDMRRSGSHYCGGSIISPEWVVTAAHCSQSSGYTLTAGDHNIDVNEGTEQVRTVDRIIVHPSYGSGKQYEHDIALMHVSVPFDFNDQVSAVVIPEAGFEPTQLATVTGWGSLSSGGSSPSNLMKVDVPYVTDAVCDVAYSGGIAESMLCYGVEGKDSCQGDSGGPIMCGANNALCGIVSWGRGCALAGFPGVYTEVSYFAEWIRSATVETAEDPTPVHTVDVCGGLIDSSSASFILTGNFSAGYRCTWTFTGRYDTHRLRLVSGLSSGDGLFVTKFDDGPGEQVQITTVGQDIRLTGAGRVQVTLQVGAGGSQGFSLEYYTSGFGSSAPALSGYANLQVPSGTYSYPIAGGQYKDGENAVFVFNPSTQGSRTLSVTRLDTESSYDEVRAYSWVNGRYTLISTFSGNNPPAPLNVAEGLAVLVFTSDSSVTQTGFSLQW